MAYALDRCGMDSVEGLSAPQEESSNLVYYLLQSLREAEGLSFREALLQAHGGDFGFYKKLDPDNSGAVSEVAWMACMGSEFGKRALKKRKKADDWLHMLLHTLKRGCGDTSLTLEQAHDCEQTFGLVSRLIDDDGLVYKEELVRAHGGDYNVFAEMDLDRSGEVTTEEWMRWLHAEHDRKGLPKGDHWLGQLLYTLRQASRRTYPPPLIHTYNVSSSNVHARIASDSYNLV